ncbi:hypothetical protein [Spirosoma oryzicola]|uniref:hypothetical protein n=1 Tax=Spirosoma oryzicola TaxID=2898794 RepID=UPI001E381590|nr:hypothetical protein [Spirosoma oryzicola]UHG92200.1 hypothetical protein LQ777_04660 [Spirosoma oryzicola]
MASHALDQRLFDQTIGIADNGTAASPADGVQLINGWLKVIEGNKSTELIEAKLKELRGLLQFANPDADRVRSLLMDLADHTEQVSQGSDIQEPTVKKLENVVDSIQKLAEQL